MLFTSLVTEIEPLVNSDEIMNKDKTITNDNILLEISNSSSNKHHQKKYPGENFVSAFNLVNKSSNNSKKVSTRKIPEIRDEYLSHDGDGVYDDYMDSPEEIMDRRPKKSQQRKNVVTFLTKETFEALKHYHIKVHFK